MSKPPKVTFRNHEPLQDYYNDGEGNIYSIARLVDDTKDLPVFDMPIAGLDLSAQIWRGCDMFELAYHVQRCVVADLDVPILIDWRGRIADGRHRVLKALADGRRTIKARRIMWLPQPDRVEPVDPQS